ncbi:MAG TPA: glycosyltransferase family 4 protein [Candidatus Binatia bacterium]|nr:glycosyltransferase family 4 protein [Candidatus Binatia bacterium]
MNVLHVIQRYPPAIGGAEAWCAGLARAQAARGDAVTVLTLAVVDEDALWDDAPRGPEPAAVGPVDLDAGVRVRRCAPSATPHAVVRAAERLGVRIGGRCSVELFGRALAAARSADAVHLHHCNVASSWWGLLAARRARRPVAVTPYFHPGDPTFEQRAARWLLRRADAVVVLSAAEADCLAARGIARHRLVVATTGVPPSAGVPPAVRTRVRAALGLPPDAALVAYLGRKAPEKDLPVLVEAAARAARTRPLALVLVGPATAWYRRALPDLVASGARVVDVPAVPDAAKRAVLAAADVLVQPSRRESFGIVFLEAWASGVPVIGAAAGAIADVVGEDGLLFAPGDPDDLARAILALLDDPARGAAMARRGAERVRRAHGWDRVAAAVARAYAVAGASGGAVAAAGGPGRREQPLERREHGVR